MSKILAFGASSAKDSMNKKLASFVANKIAPREAILIDLNDYEMPIYSDDRKRDSGIPKKAYDFKNLIKTSEGIIISFAEHNGSYTAAFKNIYDWISVIEKVVWNNKPMLLLSTSPGARGGKSVLNSALARFSQESEWDIPSFRLPNFNENFSEELGIVDNKLNVDLNEQIKLFLNQVNEHQ